MFTAGKSRHAKKDANRSSMSKYGKDAVEDRDGDGDSGEREPNTLPKMVMEVQNEINVAWDFMTSAEFNPVPHALSLLDESSLGRDYSAFCETYERLERAMDLIVNDYHQAFNTAIQTFSSVVENITDSQRRVRDTRKKLEDSKEWLQCKRFDMLHLWLKSIQYKEINRILDIVEELQTAPDRLEALIQGKYYLTAVRLLVSSMKALEEGECSEIGALEAVKQKLLEIKGSLHETLIEELHNHIYLKSAFSLYRLETEQLPPHTESTYARGHHIPKTNQSGPDRAQKPADLLNEKLGKLNSYADQEQEITEDLETNPEADSYQYMLCVIESLSALGKLPEAMELTRDRLPVELYYVVERTVQEVDHRFGKSATAFQERLQKGGVNDMKMNLLGIQSREADSGLLLDFLWELFRKFESIIQAHSFVHAVVQHISKRHGIAMDGVYTIRDVWFSAQNELKALLYEYVSLPERKTTEPSAMVSLNDILKDKRRARLRTDSQPLFRIIGDNDKLMSIYTEVNPQAMLVSDEVVANIRQSAEGEDVEAIEGASLAIVDTYATNAVATGHSMLVTPSPYNVLAVFGPTTKFVQHMEDMLRVRFGNLRIFLDEFIISVFLPQMENRVLKYFHHHVGGVDAFHAELIPDLSALPLVKSAVALTVLVQGICRTLPAIPIHQEEVVGMIEMILRGFHDKCLSRFNTLTSSNQPGADGGYSSIVSASWVGNEELTELLSQHTFFRNNSVEVNSEFTTALSEKETYMEMRLKKERSFHRSELILEQRILQAIASLHHSIAWFITQLSQLLSVHLGGDGKPPLLTKLQAARSSSESLDSYFRLSSDSLPDFAIDLEETVQLPSNEETERKFNALLSDFQRLSDTCLFVLRVELRCHAMYYLDLALREGTYYLEDDSQEPDPYIGLLNLDLSTLEEAMSIVLPSRRTRFVFDGLAYLIAHVLCTNLRHIKRVNTHGVAKLVRNVQSLQQNLTNISSVHFKNLDRAKQYFELLNLSGEGLLQHAEKQPGQFTFDECKTVLDIVYADALALDNSIQRKQYNEYLQKIKEWFVKHR